MALSPTEELIVDLFPDDASEDQAAKAAAIDAWLGTDKAFSAYAIRQLTEQIGLYQGKISGDYEFYTVPLSGGPNGDGTFNLRLPDGTQVALPGLAKLKATMAKGDTGASAFEVWKAQPGNGAGTEADYLAYLANAQIAAVTPYVDTAAAEADAAAASAAQAQGYAAGAQTDPIILARGLEKRQPNLFSEAAINIEAHGASSTIASLAPATLGGLPCWKMVVSPSATQAVAWDFPISAFAGQSLISAALRVLSVNAVPSGGIARFLIQQFDAASAEIVGTRATAVIAGIGGLSTATVFQLPGIALDPLTARVRFYLDIAAGSTSSREMHFRDMLIAGGPNASFRAPYVSTERASSAEAIAGLDSQKILTAAAAKAAREAASAPVEEALDLAVLQPNLFTQAQLATTAPLSARSGSFAPVATMKDGRPAWSCTAPAGSQRGAYMGFDRSQFGTATEVSACLQILGVDPATGGAGVARAMLMQVNAADAEIAGTRVEVQVAGVAGLSVPAWRRFAAVPLHADCARLYLYVDVIATGSSTPRTLWFSDMMVAVGRNPYFRAPPAVANALASAAEAQAGSDAAKLMTPATTKAALQFRDASGHTPNLFPDPELQLPGSTVRYPGGPTTHLIVEKNGGRAIETPSSAAVALTHWGPVLDVSKCKSGFVSVSVVVRAKDATATPADLRLRLTALPPPPSAASPLTRTGLWTSAGNDDVSSAATYYTRHLPTRAITAPEEIVVAENIPIPLDGDGNPVSYLCLSWRIHTASQMWLSHFNVREGADPTYRAPRAGRALVVVSPTGSDVTGDGSAAAPLATPNAALRALGGQGVIEVVGPEFGSTFQIDPALVTGQVLVRGVLNGEERPIIRRASKLTTITKTSGRAKIYQAAVAGLAVTPNWVWQDGVNDARTLIAASDREPEHEGRTHRLWCTKIVKATAATLSAALDEIDAAADPRCFYDAGTLYFTVAGGGDGSTADVYVTASAGLISAATSRSAGELILQNLEVRYGGVDLRPFKRAGVDVVRVLGARGNAVDYHRLTYAFLEVCGAGGHTTDGTGDGLNGHNRCQLDGLGLYSHDNMDDGESTHEYGSVRVRGGLVEHNGGAGVAPAYGCDAVYDGTRSRSNQRIPGRKAAAFNALGEPLDGALDTRARFVRCVSIDDRVSFGDNSPGLAAFAECIECVSINPTTTAYDVALIRDCRHVGTGVARSGKVVVQNAALVV